MNEMTFLFTCLVEKKDVTFKSIQDALSQTSPAPILSVWPLGFDFRVNSEYEIFGLLDLVST